MGATSFVDLQKVVAQLVRRLSALDFERGRLSKDKVALERSAAKVRHDIRLASCSCEKRRGCPICRIRCRAEDRGLAALMPGKERNDAHHAEVAKLRKHLKAAEAACAREVALREELSIE